VDIENHFSFVHGSEWIRITAGQDPLVARCIPKSGPTLVFGAHPETGVKIDQRLDGVAISLCTPVSVWLTALLEGWDEFDENGYLRTVGWQDRYPEEWRKADLN